MSQQTTRERIVAAADQLFYQHGYEHTSFADIAQHVKLSRGNFYYHFKTKDEILDAVIERRLAFTRDMLDRWEQAHEQPRDRVRSFIGILLTNQDRIEKHGCPVGTLCTELAKLGHDAHEDASQLFELFRAWLSRQFSLMGRDDAEALAMHVLAFSQGVALLANTFNDDAFIRREVAQMTAWLDGIAATAQPTN